MSQLREGLREARRMAPPVLQRIEVMRLAATMPLRDGEEVDKARREVLKWTQRKIGQQLPSQAWSGDAFEFLPGGRTTVAVKLETEVGTVWALSTERPDDQEPGRIWTHEVTIAELAGRLPQIGVRQIVATPEQDFDPAPAAPGFMRQIAEACGLHSPAGHLDDRATHVREEGDAEELLSLLVDPRRVLPVIVFTEAAGSRFPIDPDRFASGMIGLAHVAKVDADATFALSTAIGRHRSVFHGGARIYMPGFDWAANPYDHRLILGEAIDRDPGASDRSLRQEAARLSKARARPGKHFLRFADVRAKALEVRTRLAGNDNADAREQMDALRAQVAALTEENAAFQQAENVLVDEAAQAEDDRSQAQSELAAAQYRIRRLEDETERLRAGQAVEERPLPTTWDELPSWVDGEFATKLVLTTGARRSLKKTNYEDVEKVCACLRWLATDYREARIGGGAGELRSEIVTEGVTNDRCGGDAFEVNWRGRRFTSDWHLKSTSGVTRDPAKVLRVYYFWEPTEQLVVVTDLPSHRRTAIT